MFKRSNNTILLLLFGVLLAIFLIMRYCGSSKQEGTIPSELGDIDTSQVTEIQVYQKRTSKPVRLKRGKDRWKVQKGEKTHNADKGMVMQALRQISGLSPNQVVAVDSSAWKEYKVTPDAMRIKVNEGSQTALDLYLGKFSVSTSKKKRSPRMRRGPQSMKTYVRLADQPEVYAVDGRFNMTFKRDYKTWRDNTVIAGKKANWSKLSFKYPDQTFVLQQQEGNWFVDDQPADSAQVNQFLGQLTRLQNNQYVNSVNPDQLSDPHFTLSITRTEKSPITVKAYSTSDTTHQYYVTSSLNPGTVFSGKQGNLANQLLKKKSHFRGKKGR